MTNTIQTTDINHYLSGHLASVFDTMLTMQAVPSTDAGTPTLTGERVTGTVGMAGEAVTGQLYLHLPATFATQATAAMLGLPPEEIAGDSEVNDVIGEVTNMITGGLKSWLCDAGAVCALTTPAIIRGTAYTVTPKPGVQIILIAFDCQGHHGLVEVHIKFT